MKPKAFEVIEKITESPDSFTLRFAGKLDSKPGQFIMLWLPNVDEKPFAVAMQNKNDFLITIEKKGKATQKMDNVKKGDMLGIRGPFGHGFSLKDNSIIVAGGLGMASVLQLCLKLQNSTIIQGARSKDLLLYKENKIVQDAFKKQNNRVMYCTDDGTEGFHGFTTQLLEKELSKNQPKLIYSCGPEIMMTKVFELCEKQNVPCELSIERYMKCGIGLCGSCVINDQLVCRDGPVFNSEKVRKLTELGKFARLPTGLRVDLKKYHAYRS